MIISAIDKKLLRDLGRLRGQVLTIALVVASGITAYVTMQGTYVSLEYSRDAYYERYRMADVFASLRRAPESLSDRIEAIDGVATAYTRVVSTAMVPIDTLPEPATGIIVSVPPGGNPPLNGIYLTAGRMVEPGRSDEAVLLESFAEKHEMVPGDTLPVVVNGTLRTIRIVGIGMSPEYVFPPPLGGMFADAERIAVLWMDREGIAPAYEMDGAFNDVTIRLQPDASIDNVKTDLDRLLEPYGGAGSVGRDKQISNYILSGEMSQLEVFATVAPAIFLGVAAFLLNVVLARLVLLQRSQIATLKAVGYGDWAIGLHFLKLVSVIVIIGAILGIAFGAYLGREFTELYTEYFRFPLLAYRLDTKVIFVAIFVSLLAAVVGALVTVRRVAKLPPAEAMRPAPPVEYRRTVLDRMGVGRLIGPSGRMVMREIERRPLRMMLSVFGIAMAVAICVLGRFMGDAIDHMMNTQFHEAMREDVTVGFLEPVPRRSVRELEHLPGVLHAEGSRIASVRFRNGHRFRDSSINGYPEEMELRRVLDRHGQAHPIPEDGVMITKTLGELLDLEIGDMVTVEIREGDRRHEELRVAAFIDESFGLQGHMRQEALWRLLREDDTVSVALLRIDPYRYEDIQSRLKEMPTVGAVLSKKMIIEQFREQSGDWINVMVIIMTILGSIIAIGVVYNNARIALSMRARDMASLRVLGFTRHEISGILIGELSIQVLLAIPIGWVIGAWLAQGMMATNDPEQYRFAVVLSAQTYAYAALVTMASGLFSAFLVRRKLDRLDLIAVLKTRE